MQRRMPAGTLRFPIRPRVWSMANPKAPKRQALKSPPTRSSPNHQTPEHNPNPAGGSANGSVGEGTADHYQGGPDSPAAVTARIVRATSSGLSIIGTCPTPGSVVNDAWGSRSRAIGSHIGTGMIASLPDQAMVTGHGTVSSGARYSSEPRMSSTLRLQPEISSTASMLFAAESRSPCSAALRKPTRRTIADCIASATKGRVGRASRPIATNLWISFST